MNSYHGSDIHAYAVALLDAHVQNQYLQPACDYHHNMPNALTVRPLQLRKSYLEYVNIPVL